MALKNKCPYCFYKLAEDGFCARVCKMGALKRRQHELEEAAKQQENVVTEEPITEPIPEPASEEVESQE